MSDPFGTLGEPGEPKADYIKAKDLLNLPCLIRVTAEGEYPAAPEELNADGSVKEKAKRAQPYLECDVAILGAGGVENHDSGVRIAWTRVVGHQISIANKGVWFCARPKEVDNNAVILTTFDEKGKAAAAALLPEVEALFAAAAPAPEPATTPAPPAYADGEEPF